MKAYAVRRDRADVMALRLSVSHPRGYLNPAAVCARPRGGCAKIFLGCWAGEIAREAFRAKSRTVTTRRAPVALARRSFGGGWDTNSSMAETRAGAGHPAVRPVAAGASFAGASAGAAEAGALLHDTGHLISHRGITKHGEYLG